MAGSVLRMNPGVVLRKSKSVANLGCDVPAEQQHRNGSERNGEKLCVMPHFFLLEIINRISEPLWRDEALVDDKLILESQLNQGKFSVQLLLFKPFLKMSGTAHAE